MQDEARQASSDEFLIQNLGHQDARIRMLSLHLLCEGYVDNPAIFQALIASWEKWGHSDAFEEFPMLSFVPLGETDVEAACNLAGDLAEGRKLTATRTRVAGKLMEQVCFLPPVALVDHVPLMESTIERSKIFFRVDLKGVRNRIGLIGLGPDELAKQLDASVGQLAEDSSDQRAVHLGLHALEALRRQHPDYLDLPMALSKSPPNDGPAAISFQLILNSLTQIADLSSIDSLEKHLHDPRESIYSMVVEALVRTRSDEAASAMLRSLPGAPTGNQRWIARGLQRLRVDGFAQHITQVRNSVTDPTLWLMLLIAEVRQFDISQVERLAAEVGRVQTLSEPLVDSLTLFLQAFEDDSRIQVLKTAWLEYLQRANNSVAQKLRGQKSKLQKQDKSSRAKLRKKILEDYRKEN